MAGKRKRKDDDENDSDHDEYKDDSDMDACLDEVDERASDVDHGGESGADGDEEETQARPRKRAKRSASGATGANALRAEIIERAQATQLLTTSPPSTGEAATATTAQVSSAVRRRIEACTDSDLVHKATRGRKKRYLFVLPCHVALDTGAGDSLGQLHGLDSESPSLLIPIPAHAGRLVMQGSIVYPQAKYLIASCAGKAAAEVECVDALVVFSKLAWLAGLEGPFAADQLSSHVPSSLLAPAHWPHAVQPGADACSG